MRISDWCSYVCSSDLPLRYRQQARFRTGTRMNVDRVPVGDGEALRPQRFQSDVVGAAGDGALDLGVEELLERREEDALEFDRQGEQPVEERRDRRSQIGRAHV